MKKALLALLALSLPLTAQAAPFSNDAARYALPEAQMVGHIDFERLRESKTFKDLYAMLSANPNAQRGLADLEARFGIKILSDLSGITFSINAPKPTGATETFVFASGLFDEAKVMAGMKKGNADYDEGVEGAQKLYVAQGDKTALAFVKGGLLAANSQVSATGSVEGEGSMRKVIKSQGLSGAIKALSAQFSAGKDMWFALSPNAEMLAQLKTQDPQMAAFTSWTLSLDMGAGLHIHAEGVGTAEAASGVAAKLTAQVQGAMASPQAAMLGGIITKFSVKAEGDKLVLDLPLSQQDVEQLKMLGMMAMAAMQSAARPEPQPSFPALQQPAKPSALTPAPAPLKINP